MIAVGSVIYQDTGTQDIMYLKMAVEACGVILR